MAEIGIAERLLPGEHIEWQGRPVRGIALVGNDIWISLVAALPLIGATYIFSNLPRGLLGGDWVIYLVFGIFVAVSFYGMVGRLLIDAWVRGSIEYAVTDRRVLISRRLPVPKFTALALGNLATVSLVPAGGGRGTIYFGEPPRLFSRRNSIPPPTSLEAMPQFLAIAEAQGVYDLIQRLQQGG